MTSLILYLSMIFGGPAPAWGQELVDVQRGLHPWAAGYLDAAQFQTLAPTDPATHAALGQVRGFTEIRRLTGVLLGPETGSPTRWGVLGAIQAGGWTSDLYLSEAPDLHREVDAWAAGVAFQSMPLGLVTLAGIHATSPTRWRGPGSYEAESGETDLWANLRSGRYGILGAGDLQGPSRMGLALLSDPRPLRSADPWFWPQFETSLFWTRSDWNAWGKDDALGGDIRAPLLNTRIALRTEASTDGFHFAQLVTNLSPEGLVGLDASITRRNEEFLPGFKFRAMILTLGLNDPDDIALTRLHGSVLWSFRLQMTWEDHQTWYAPGYRAKPSEAHP